MAEGFADATQLRRRRAVLKRRYGVLYDELESVFFEHDPIGISYTPDEYDPEVELLLPKLTQVRSAAELTDAIHSTFRDMFTPRIAGPRRKYEPIARDIWSLVTRSANETAAPRGRARRPGRRLAARR